MSRCYNIALSVREDVRQKAAHPKRAIGASVLGHREHF